MTHAHGSARWRAISCGIAAFAVGAVLLSLPLAPAFAQSTDPAHQQFLFAYKLLQRGDVKEAAEEFDEFLGNFPRDEKLGDALYYRALLYRKARDNASAARLLEKAPKPKLVPGYAVHLLQGQVLADLKQYDAALKSLEQISTDELKPQVAASVLYLRGLAYRGAGNLAAAEKSLAAAADLKTTLRPRAMLDQARAQALQEKLTEAIATLDRALKLEDAHTAAEAARLAGELAYQKGDYDAAVRYYGQVLTAHQSSRHFGAAVVGSLWAHYAAGRYRMVLEVYARYLPTLPVQDRVAATYLAGSAHQELGEHEQAAEMLKQISHGEGRYPLQEKVLYKLAASQFELNQTEDMAATLARLRTLYPDSPLLVDSAFLLAAADARGGDVARGAARLTELIDQGKNHPYYLQALLRRARLYEQHSQDKEAAADYERFVTESTEDSRQVHQAALRLIDLTYRMGEYQRAATAAAALLKRPGLEPLAEQEALYRQGIALVKLGKFDEALAAFDRLQARHRLSDYRDEASYYRGLILLGKKEPAKAAKLLNEASQAKTLPIPLRANALRLLWLQAREENPAAAADHLTRLEKLAGLKALNARELLWRGRYELERGQPKAASKYLQQLLDVQQAVELDERVEGLYLVGQVLRALGDTEGARKAFTEVLARGEGFEKQSQLEMARLSLDAGHYEQAIAELNGLISSDEADIAAAALFDTGIAYRQLAQSHLQRDDREGAAKASEDARTAFKRLVLLYAAPRLEPLPQQALVELYEIAVKLGDAEATERELGELMSKYPDGPYATYAKAMLARHRGRLGEALATLRSLDGSELDPRLAEKVKQVTAELEAGR